MLNIIKQNKFTILTFISTVLVFTAIISGMSPWAVFPLTFAWGMMQYVDGVHRLTYHERQNRIKR